MGQATLTTFLAGLVFVSLFVIGLVPFMSSLAVNYNTHFDNSSFEVYNKLVNISTAADIAQTGFKEAYTDKGTFDILGNLLNQGKQVVSLLAESANVIFILSNNALSDLGLGSFKIGMGVLLAIFLFVTIGLHLLIKSERI